MYIHLNTADILKLDQRYRANLINSIGGFKSVALIATSANDQANVAIFNSIVHIGAHPPLVGFVVRPDSVERHTLENILDTNVYTINHITSDIYMQAHQTSARYPRDVSEFDAVELEAEYKENFAAPYVKESHIQIGLIFKEKIDIALNQTSLIIGEIQHIYMPEHCVQEDGFVDLEKAGTVTSAGLDSYYTVNKLGRLRYAKPNELPSIL
jgi:flavin reductase (DIM6/NTAB) family NADH-FMN oxidoreductase RutF